MPRDPFSIARTFGARNPRTFGARDPRPFGARNPRAFSAHHPRAFGARNPRAFGAHHPRAHSACTLLGLRQLSPAPRTCGPRSQARELAQQGMPRARAGGGTLARKRGVWV